MTWRLDMTARLQALRTKAGQRIRPVRPEDARTDHDCLQVGAAVISRSSRLQEFLDAYFGSPADKCVIQIGANDGLVCDPLRRYLAPSRGQNLRAVLVEPIPFYHSKLESLYAAHPDITVMNAACGAAAGTAPLFFLDPAIADRMNGQGPANDWAHGQGSFDRGIVAYWIDRNRFRGDEYVKEIDTFHAAIRSIDVEIIPVSEIALSRWHENLLVVIDVQGFELDVIRGIDWDHPPAFIMFEDDLGRSAAIDEYLGAKGYRYLCGRTDKVYARA